MWRRPLFPSPGAAAHLPPEVLCNLDSSCGAPEGSDDCGHIRELYRARPFGGSCRGCVVPFFLLHRRATLNTRVLNCHSSRKLEQYHMPPYVPSTEPTPPSLSIAVAAGVATFPVSRREPTQFPGGSRRALRAWRRRRCGGGRRWRRPC